MQGSQLTLNPFVTSGTYMSTYKESFQVHWDNSIPLFLHAAIYLEVSLFRWTSQNAFSRETAVYKWYCVCFSTFVRPRPGKFFFHMTRARSQQIYS